jgi:hypothetical protein
MPCDRSHFPKFPFQDARPAPADCAGQAIAEFLFCAITFLFVLLGSLQLVLLLNAQIAVNYAAYNAARAAIVNGCDSNKMRTAVEMSLAPVFPKHGRASTPLGFMQNVNAAAAVDSNTGWWGLNGDPITKISMTKGPGGGQTVTFDDTAQGARSVITVEVVHQYELIIPLVNGILFQAMTLGRRGRLGGKTLDKLAKEAAAARPTSRNYSGYRYPLSSTYTMHLQSDCRG